MPLGATPTLHVINVVSNNNMVVTANFWSVTLALGYGLDDLGSRVRFPAGTRNFSLYHRVQNGSGTPQPPTSEHQGLFPWGLSGWSVKLDHSPPSSAEVKAWVELYLRSPNTPSWHGAQFEKKSTGTPFPLPLRNF